MPLRLKVALVKLKSNRKITTALWTQAQMIVIWLIFSEVYRKVKVRFQKKKERERTDFLKYKGETQAITLKRTQ